MVRRMRGRGTQRQSAAPRVGVVSLCALFIVTAPAIGVAEPVGAGSGPLSEVSRSVKDGSRSVHEGRQSVRDGSAGSMKSGPVRGDRRLGMLSGSVSDASVGPVTAGRPMTGGGSMTASSAGAVKQEMDHSLGEQVYDLQRTLGPLQDRLRQQAEMEELAARRDAATSESDEQEEDTEIAPVEPQVQVLEDSEAADETEPVDEIQPVPDELDN